MIKQQVYADTTRTFGDAMSRSLAAMRVSFG
jgi:hypothetical protein